MKVELICFLYNKKLADMEIEHDDLLAKVTIDTDQIESVMECGKGEGDEIDQGTCMVYLRSGQSIQIGKPYKDMLDI
jgi:hypothetical protein